MFAPLEWMVRTYLGKAGDTGGSATAGTVTAKVNNIINNTVTNNTASSTGTLSQKLSQIINTTSATNRLSKTRLHQVSATGYWTNTMQNFTGTYSGQGILLGIWIDNLIGGTNPSSVWSYEFDGTLNINSSGSVLAFSLPTYKLNAGTTNTVYPTAIGISPVGFTVSRVSRNVAGWGSSAAASFVQIDGYVPLFLPFDVSVSLTLGYKVTSGSGGTPPRINFLYAAA